MRYPLNISVVSLSSKKVILGLMLASTLAGAAVALVGCMMFSISVASTILLMVAVSSLSAAGMAKYLSHALSRGKLRPQVRFGKVSRVNMIKKIIYNQCDDDNIVIDKAIEDEIRAQHGDKSEPVQFQTATLLYDTINTTNNTDTFQRDQALLNARIVLLSMDHTKQIPH